MSKPCKYPNLVINENKQFQIQYDATISSWVEAKTQDQAFLRMHDTSYTEQRELVADGVCIYMEQIDFTDEQIDRHIELCHRIGNAYDEPFRQSFNKTFLQQNLDSDYVLTKKLNRGGL